MKNAAYDYKCVDDNIRYLKKWGAKHKILVINKRITNYTQGLQFGRRDDSYLWRCITIIKEQPFKCKWRGIFDDELLSFKTNSNAFKVRRLYLETTDTNFYSQNNQQVLQGSATLRMMACGVPTDYIDDNLGMEESTAIFYVKQFAMTMVEMFGP